MTREICVLIGTALFAANLSAQVTSSDILGTVRDASDAVVPDAQVTVKQLETNATRETRTDSDGRFRIPALPPGTYEVVVTKSGFTKLVRGPVVLHLNQPAELDVKLQVSAVGE